MAEKSKRVFAFTMAMVFLGTVLAGGLFVLWDVSQDDSAEVSSEIQEQNTTVGEEEKVDDPNKLEGKQLAGFDPVQNVNQLEVIDVKEGSGEVVKEGATVTAHYTGALAKSGKIFQSSKDMGQPIEFGLDQVIPGWTEGVPGMKVGGERRLIIPAEMAYGETGSPPAIGPNEPLVFDIELTDVQNP